MAAEVAISDGAAAELRLFAHGWLGPNVAPTDLRSSALRDVVELLDAKFIVHYSADEPAILSEECSPRRHAYLLTESGHREALRRRA